MEINCVFEPNCKLTAPTLRIAANAAITAKIPRYLDKLQSIWSWIRPIRSFQSAERNFHSRAVFVILFVFYLSEYDSNKMLERFHQLFFVSFNPLVDIIYIKLI